jgi:hypothetical protein
MTKLGSRCVGRIRSEKISVHVFQDKVRIFFSSEGIDTIQITIEKHILVA